MPNEIITLKNVHAGYNGNMVLEDITLSIEENEFLGIIGPNGGGKTTLLKVILGLIEPEKGEIKVFASSPRHRRNLIGYVPQYTHFFEDFPIKVWDVVLMGRLGRRGFFRNYSKEDREIALEALDLVSMRKFRNDQIGFLSEGQKQRIFIARALATQAKVLLLDEPTASVDSPMQTSLYELLKELSEKMTIILISHDLGVISSHVNHIACLNRKLYYHGTSEISTEELEKTYQCPIEVIGHGHTPHRILKEHD